MFCSRAGVMKVPITWDLLAQPPPLQKLASYQYRVGVNGSERPETVATAPRTSPNKSGIKRNRGRNDAPPGLKIFPTSEHSIPSVHPLLPLSSLYPLYPLYPLYSLSSEWRQRVQVFNALTGKYIRD